MSMIENQLQEQLALSKTQALRQIAEMCVIYSIDIEQLPKILKPYVKKISKAELPNLKRKTRSPKYLNPKTGQTWAGTGKTPKWLAGKNPDDFLIK